VPAYDRALVRLALHDSPGALQGLNDTVDEHSAWAIYIGADPRLDPLRADARFPAILARAGLPGSAAPAAR
jgi:hypothetical protein